MRKGILLLIFMLFLLSGCKYSASEPDDKSYVTAIGIDKGEEYNLRFTFVFASPSKDGEKTQSGEKDETIVIEAPSIYSAIEEMNAFKSKEVRLTHTQTIIFSEELAKEGIEEYIYSLVRSDNFRPNTFVCIADKSSMEFLEQIKPTQTITLEKYFEQLFSNQNSGNYGEMYLYDTYFDLLSANGTSVLPLCSVNVEQIETSSKSEEEASEGESEKEDATESEDIGKFSEDTDDFAINLIAGGTLQGSENPAEIQGAAVLKNGIFVASLGRTEKLALQLVTNGLADTYLTVVNPQSNEDMITVRLTRQKNARIEVKTAEIPKISINIFLEGDFTAVGKNSYYIDNSHEFEVYLADKIKDEIEKLLQKSSAELGCDICSLSEYAKSEFLTVGEWEDYNWNEKYPNAEFDVSVKITMRTHGELSRQSRGE